MNIENLLVTFLSILLPLFGGAIGYLYKQGIDKKKELQNEVNKERREMYQQFVNLTVDLLKNVKTEKETKDSEVISKFFEFYKKYILFGSPKVIISCGEYLQHIYHLDVKEDVTITFRKLSRVMLEMRKDLGLSNDSLGKDGEKLLRAIITDFDNYIK